MTRILCFVVCIVAMLSLICCSSEPVEPDTHTASIERLCEETDWSAEQAQAVLSLLATLGHEGEIMLAYPATDKQKATYYHIWIGEHSVDVYLNEDGTVARVYQGGISIYGEDAVDAPNEDQPPVDIPAENPPVKDETDIEQPTENTPVEDQPTGNTPTEEKPDEDPPVEIKPDEDKTTEDEPDGETTLTLDELTEQVVAGSNAKLSVYGTPGKEYRIEVHYKSGISEAKGLEDQVAADDGLLCWTWKVSARTTPGEYKIRVVCVSDESDVLELLFKVK